MQKRIDNLVKVLNHIEEMLEDQPYNTALLEMYDSINDRIEKHKERINGEKSSGKKHA